MLILSIKDDVEFLEAYLKKLIKAEWELSELEPWDLVSGSDDTIPTTDEDAERAARLADDYGFEGNIFRNLWGYRLEPKEFLSTAFLSIFKFSLHKGEQRYSIIS